MRPLAIASVWALAVIGCTSTRGSEPATAELATDELTLHEARFGRRLWAGARPEVVEGTDAIPPRAFFLEERGVRSADPILAIDGWLTARGAVFVTADAELIDAGRAVLADVVEADLGVSPEGDRIALSRHDEDDGGLTTVYVLALDEGTPTAVSQALDDALMPFFLSDGNLLVTGAHHGEILGLFHVDLATGSARRLTNDGLLIGRGPDPRFVPVPLGARHIRELPGGAVSYFDGEGEQTVSWRATSVTPPSRLGETEVSR